uniref:NACHT, LRR and PYD domains-containing protein 3-like n=1 Tax=Lepisosteus oculatus TaxID=7918 RepID=W5LWS9_LEPOC|nr:PREDICTED: NACHT, LRR and PYD domains-containing protein 3-like isoform X2 [Lepisosteus oculatus]XP_015194562.1 PREDICTED: NACHT, LRR and PYD domains-containing protein 3-like isoform X2 [Lepisosteus oculatus]
MDPEMQRIKLGKPVSPEPRSVSMSSDHSMERPITFRNEDSDPSCTETGNVACYFCKMEKTALNNYMVHVHQLHAVAPLQRTRQVEITENQELRLCQQHHRTLILFFKSNQTLACNLSSEQKHRGHDINFLKTEHGSTQEMKRAVTEHKGKTEDFCTGEFQEMGSQGWLNTLRRKHKANLRRKFEYLFEEVAKPGKHTLLSDGFTHVKVSQGISAEVNYGHEISQLETIFKSPKSQIQSIRYNDIFKPLEKETKPIRTVLTKGIAGIGKTFSVQRFIVDWASQNENQDFDLIFLLPFIELNLIKAEISLLGLLQCFYPEIKSYDNILICCKILFIFDGLDESRFALNFETNQRLSDVKKEASVDVLLTNLIQGNFNVYAFIWITSRPATAGLIPLEHISRVTEVQGFEDQQKEEFIRKKCKEKVIAEKIISHIQKLRSLYIMCYVPVICRIVVSVLEHTLKENNEDNMKSLTDLYTNFLVVALTAKKDKKNQVEHILRSNQEVLMKLGKLAFENLEKSNMVFYDKDLTEYGIDLNNSSLSSGLCKEIFKQKSVLFQEKVYCFLHLTVQEYFAALYVFGSFQNSNINLLKKTFWIFFNFGTTSLFSLNEAALQRATLSRNGHLDLFVQFLLGMGTKNNQNILKGFLSNTEDHSNDIHKTAGYIKKLIRESLSCEKYRNLFHCLSELKEDSLMDEFNVTLVKGKLRGQTLTPSQCSALTYYSLLSENVIDDFDMSQYATSEECIQRLLPVANISKTLRMENFTLTQKCCDNLASALQSQHSNLRKLCLRDNTMGHSEVKLLCAALRSPHCKLETLRMSWSGLTDRCCEDLASVLQSQYSSLRELDLPHNDLNDFGVKLLSAALCHQNCKLETLSMKDCGLTKRCSIYLNSALLSQHFNLRHLNLSYNNLWDSGVKLLSAALMDPKCKLESLRVSWCVLTDRCCIYLASALQSQHSCLRELDLSFNNLGDSGVKLLSTALKNHNCKLHTLWMHKCGLTKRCCKYLSSALQSQHCSLRQLNLSYNKLVDTGVKLLSSALMDPRCKLQSLGMEKCELTERCCEDLASVLMSQKSNLRWVYLCGNNLGESGMKLLSIAQRSHYNKV